MWLSRAQARGVVVDVRRVIAHVIVVGLGTGARSVVHANASSALLSGMAPRGVRSPLGDLRPRERRWIGARRAVRGGIAVDGVRAVLGIRGCGHQARGLVRPIVPVRRVARITTRCASLSLSVARWRRVIRRLGRVRRPLG